MTPKKPVKRGRVRSEIRAPKGCYGFTFFEPEYCHDGLLVKNYSWILDAKDCRRLAKWLIKAADYLEQKEKTK